MTDQADTLRKMMRQRKPSDSNASRENFAKVVTVSSGKGGVGKSCLVANLGTLLARMGHKVLLIDGDMGLANLDILLGVQPIVTLEQVLDGKATAQQAVVGVEPNLWLIPAAAGLLEHRESDQETRTRLLSLLDGLPWEMDFILLDIGAGIQENVLSLHHPSFESLVMLTPEPTSLTDAYGLIKLLRRHSGISNAGVIVNQVTDGREGQLAFQRLRDVSAKFIDVKLDYMGHWNRDEKITQSVMKRKILLDWNSGSVSPAVASLELIAKRLRSKLLGKYLASSDDKNGQTRFLWGNRIRSSQPLTTGEQSGNTAGFFRTLLTGSSGSFLKR